MEWIHLILPRPVTAKLLAAAVLPGRHLAGGGWCGDTLALSAPLDTTTVTNIITLKHCVVPSAVSPLSCSGVLWDRAGKLCVGTPVVILTYDPSSCGDR